MLEKTVSQFYLVRRSYLNLKDVNLRKKCVKKKTIWKAENLKRAVLSELMIYQVLSYLKSSAIRLLTWSFALSIERAGEHLGT